jgi:folate-binding protein YgfZ
MSEVVTETPTLRTTPLSETHAALGAAMTERDGWSVPANYGDPLFEYAAVREGGAGLIDLSSRGRMLVSGSEAVQFLNGLITNDMKTLGENCWMPAAFPNVQGRLLASVRMLHQSPSESSGSSFLPGASSFLIDTEPATHAAVLKTIGRFTLAGDFHVNDLTAQTALISLQGARAVEIIRGLFGELPATLERFAVAVVPWSDKTITIIRASHTGEDGFDLCLEASADSSAFDLWQALLQAGARPTGFEALDILRVEAGQPRYGADMDETNVVSETGLDEAISFTKGCYIGQEIIARIKYRGHVAKRLSGLVFAHPVRVEPGAKINAVDGKEIGRITSATLSPHLGKTIALGYVKYDYLAPGTEVKVIAGAAEILAQVTDLPFVARW